ncbi:hypothetical protein [Rhizobium leguminosarum]|nr:hypothetical protein [Rhizobium leguminosarum]
MAAFLTFAGGAHGLDISNHAGKADRYRQAVVEVAEMLVDLWMES